MSCKVWGAYHACGCPATDTEASKNLELSRIELAQIHAALGEYQDHLKANRRPKDLRIEDIIRKLQSHLLKD